MSEKYLPPECFHRCEHSPTGKCNLVECCTGHCVLGASSQPDPRELVEPRAEDRYIAPTPLPTPRQREVLVILIEELAEITEECARVQHRAVKALRFGLGDIQVGQPLTNSARLSEEVGDLSAVLDMATREGILSARLIESQRVLKERKLMKYMQTERE